MRTRNLALLVTAAACAAVSATACGAHEDVAATSEQAIRTAPPGSIVYDIAIYDIQAMDIFHALMPQAQQFDSDHVYLSALGTDSQGNAQYFAHYNDGSTNYFNDLRADGQARGAAGAPFVLSGLPILSGDNITIAMTIDSRNHPTVASTFAPWQSQEIAFVDSRAYAFAMGLQTNTEALPWQTDGNIPVDFRNAPLWVQGDGEPVFNPLFQARTPSDNCDGYVGAGNLRIPADEIVSALRGQGDGASIILTEELTMQAPVPTVCATAPYPNGPDDQNRHSGTPNAQPLSTVRFVATIRTVPYPDFGNPPPPCKATGLTPANTTSPGAWTGLWADQPTVQGARVSAQVDPEDGWMDVSTHEVVHIYATSTVDSALSRTIPWIKPEPDYQGDKFPSRFHVSGGPTPTYSHDEHLMSSNNVELIAYTGRCADGTAVQRMRYLRRSAGSVVTDVMLQPARNAAQ